MFSLINKYIENYAIHKTRQQLLSLSDSQLQDVGISRDLLNQGNASWPWRENDMRHLSPQPARMNAKQINSAIRELSRMSDKDLRDIGIDRGSIRHSVMNGRSGPGRAA